MILKSLIAASAMFLLWQCGGTNSSLHSSLISSFIALEHSLSSTCFLTSKPVDLPLSSRFKYSAPGLTCFYWALQNSVAIDGDHDHDVSGSTLDCDWESSSLIWLDGFFWVPQVNDFCIHIPLLFPISSLEVGSCKSFGLVDLTPCLWWFKWPFTVSSD